MIPNMKKISCYFVDVNENYLVATLSNSFILFCRNKKEINLINEEREITCIKLDSFHQTIICGLKNGTVKIWNFKNLSESNLL